MRGIRGIRCFCNFLFFNSVRIRLLYICAKGFGYVQKRPDFVMLEWFSLDVRAIESVSIENKATDSHESQISVAKIYHSNHL